jgi:hypothetical protein
VAPTLSRRDKPGFLIFGCVNKIIYSVRIHNIQHLKQEAAASVSPHFLDRMWQEMEYLSDVCRAHLILFIHLFIYFELQMSFYPVAVVLRPHLLSSGQNSWLQNQRSRVRFSALQDFLSSNGSGMWSTQPLRRYMRKYLKENCRLQSSKLRLTAVGVPPC